MSLFDGQFTVLASRDVPQGTPGAITWRSISWGAPNHDAQPPDEKQNSERN